jgi:serine/threonine protein kinase
LTIVKLLNNGKSAAVFKAVDADNRPVALKIFDNEFLKRFGFDVQLKRINQEVDLKGHGISGLVNIIDGGQDNIGGTDYFFILMNFIPGKNIKEYIEEMTYDISMIKKVSKTLYEVTEQLLLRGIAHRDIKPENIMIADNGEVILMDLGVIKPIGAPSLSDAVQKEFVGTLRYAPPEFLLRTEEDTPAGWKAINFYQIGAVMHDMCIKQELLHDVNPFSRLVLAIIEDTPTVSSNNYSFETNQLIRDLLAKSPKVRTSMVSDKRLSDWFNKSDKVENGIEVELEKIRQLVSPNKTELVAIESIRRSNVEKKKIRDEISKELGVIVDNCFNTLSKSGVFKQYQKSPGFSFHSDRQFHSQYSISNNLFEIKSSLEDGFPSSLYLLVKTKNDELSDATADLLGIIMPSTNRPPVGDPLKFFQALAESQRIGSVVNRLYNPNEPINLHIPVYHAFKGTLGLDKQLEEKLTLDILMIIKKAIQLMTDETVEELKWQKELVTSPKGVTMRTINSKPVRLIDNLD